VSLKTVQARNVANWLSVMDKKRATVTLCTMYTEHQWLFVFAIINVVAWCLLESASVYQDAAGVAKVYAVFRQSEQYSNRSIADAAAYGVRFRTPPPR